MNVTANVVTLDLADITAGGAISSGVKFQCAASGFAINKYFDYLIGNDCCTASTKYFTSNAVKMYPNPAKEVVSFSSASNIAFDAAVY